MNLTKILQGKLAEGVEITEIIDSIKAEICTDFVSKKQYSNKVNQIDQLQEKINDLEAKEGNTDGFKEKYEALEQEFNTYKENIETEKTNQSKLNLINQSLEKAGVTKAKLRDLLVKTLDLSAIEIENDEIKDFDKSIEAMKGDYADFFEVTETLGGNEPGNPPANNNNPTEGNPLADALGKYI